MSEPKVAITELWVKDAEYTTRYTYVGDAETGEGFELLNVYRLPLALHPLLWPTPNKRLQP